MKKMIFLFLSVSIVLYAKECVNFNNCQNENVILPIMVELHKKGIESYLNTEKKCRLQVYLPIEVLINSDNKQRDVSVFLKIQNRDIDNNIVYKKVTFSDNNTDIYDLNEIEPKSLKMKLIKSHATIIADVIRK